MELDLIQSPVYRQSILNNSIAIKEVEKNLDLNQLYFTNQQVADFYEVSLATIERTISDNSIELKSNGLRTLRGQELEDVIAKDFVTLKNDGHKVVNLTVSTFKTVLNFGMLLKTSEKARLIRTKVLDVTIEVLENKTSKNTKFINQRDKDYLSQAQREAIERKKFTNAIKEYIDMGNYKYAYFTNEVYKAIFKERTQEYKKLLDLSKNDNARHTMYSEVLVIIASFESGLSDEFKNESVRLGRKITREEADQIISNFSSLSLWKPLLDDARTKMATRDNTLRDVYHEKLSEYMEVMTPEEYEKFLGEQSKSLEQQIKENRAVFERLKDK